MKNTTRNPILIFTIMLAILSGVDDAHARRHRKFKGVIIVNQLLKLDGTATNNGQPALEFSAVKQGDVLTTGEKSSAVIRIVGLGIFRLGPKTTFKITRFSDRNESRMELIGGEVLSVYRRPGNHEFKTPRGIINFHSAVTFFASGQSEAKSGFVCLCDGKINLQNIISSSEAARRALPVVMPSAFLNKAPVESAPGKSAPVISAIKGAPPAPAPVLASPSPVEEPSPSPPKEFVDDSNIASQWNHKQIQLSENGIEVIENEPPKDHSDKQIKELESLYSLP